MYLGDLAPAGLAFLAQLHPACGTTIDIICMMIDAEMYGMTPMAKIDRRDERAAREHVDDAEDGVRLVLEEARHAPGSMPGTGMNVPMR